MENSFSKHSKKKQFGKLNSLTSVESLKTPKLRRKSLGTVLPTPNASQISLDLNRRKSLEPVRVSKKSKKQKNSLILPENAFKIPLNLNKDVEKQTKHSLGDSSSLTPKKTNKKRSSVNEPLTTTSKKKRNIPPHKSTPLVLAPAEDEDSPSILTQTSKNFKKPPKKEILKSQDESNPERKVRLESLGNKFNIKLDDVENALNGVIKFASNNPQLQNQLFNEEIPLFLQINSFKIPQSKGPVKQLFRVPMQHSILPSDADICLIVPDVKGVKNNEHEKHLEHYENLLHSKDVTGIKKIMTFHEFRTEYETFELKNRLVDLYDAFLVDGKISGKVVNKCGSIFYNKRKVPISVKLYLPKLKSHIDKALKKVYFRLNVRSDSNIVQIGHSKNSTEELIENVYSLIEFLDGQFPGKMDNIRSLNVYAHRGSSIPIYVSLKNPNEVKVPTLSNKKPKAYKSFSGELTTQYNAEVVVRPSGKVIVKRKKAYPQQNKGNPDDHITDAEIITENKKIDNMEEENGDRTDTNTKSAKKRKRSKSAKDQEVKNPLKPSQSDPKKPKQERKLLTKNTGKQVHSAEPSKADKAQKKNVNRQGEAKQKNKKKKRF